MTLTIDVGSEMNRVIQDSLAVKSRKQQRLFRFMRNAGGGGPKGQRFLGSPGAIPVDVSALVGYGSSAKTLPQASNMRPRASE